jgi:hypothetical protein
VGDCAHGADPSEPKKFQGNPSRARGCLMSSRDSWAFGEPYRPVVTKRKRMSSALIGLTVFFTVAMGAIAFADPVVNNLDVTADAAAETATTTVWVPVSVGFFATASNTDPSGDASGCNATGANPATLTITAPAGVTPTTTTLTLVGCGSTNAQSASFSAAAAGTYSFASGAFSLSGGKSGSLWNTTTAAFTLRVDTAPPADTTAPTLTVTPPTPDGDNGWFVTSPVSVPVSATDASGVADITCSPAFVESSSTSTSKNGTVSVSAEGTTTVSCTATDGASPANTTDAVTADVKIDTVKPTISGAPDRTANSNGWYNADVTVSFTCSDGTSGVASCSAASTLGEGANQSVTGSAVDNAGNSESATVSGINIDKTAPIVALVGGPADGGSYYFGSVPAAPTCSASDGLSGLDGSCSVSGYSTAVGTHTVTASATDKAGNSNSASATYTVLAWTLNGFYQPVDMGTSVLNTVKAGSTVPLKFEVFAGLSELTDVAVVDTFKTQEVNCSALDTTVADAIEVTTTGGTSLRYDTTAGQFVQNWQTPKKTGACYVVTMTTDDGTKISANFKLK